MAQFKDIRIVEALMIGALGTAVGIGAGHARPVVDLQYDLAETIPDIGTVVSVTPRHLCDSPPPPEARRRGGTGS